MKGRSTPCRKAEADAHVSKTDVAMGTYQDFGGLMNMIETPKRDGSKEDAIRIKIEKSYIELLDHLLELVEHLSEDPHIMETVTKHIITKAEAMRHIETADYSDETLPTMWPDSGWHYDMEKRYQVVRFMEIDGVATPTETIGYVHEDLRDDEAFWTSLCDDEAVIEILEPEHEPHAGITCEYTGLVISEPWYFVEFAVDPTACDNGNEAWTQGAEYALTMLLGQAEQYAIEGWSIDFVDLDVDIKYDSNGDTFVYYASMDRSDDDGDLSICLRVTDKSNPKRWNERVYWEPLSDVDDDDTESGESPRHRCYDALNEFFHIKNESMGLGFTCVDVNGGMILRHGDTARRFGTVRRFDRNS